MGVVFEEWVCRETKLARKERGMGKTMFDRNRIMLRKEVAGQGKVREVLHSRSYRQTSEGSQTK